MSIKKEKFGWLGELESKIEKAHSWYPDQKYQILDALESVLLRQFVDYKLAKVLEHWGLDAWDFFRAVDTIAVIAHETARERTPIDVALADVRVAWDNYSGLTVAGMSYPISSLAVAMSMESGLSKGICEALCREWVSKALPLHFRLLNGLELVDSSNSNYRNLKIIPRALPCDMAKVWSQPPISIPKIKAKPPTAGFRQKPKQRIDLRKILWPTPTKTEKNVTNQQPHRPAKKNKK